MSYVSRMSGLSEKETREAVEKFVGRKGHGAIKDLADIAGITRTYLSRFKNGGSVEKRTLLAIQAALGELEDPGGPSELSKRLRENLVLSTRMRGDGFLQEIARSAGVQFTTLRRFRDRQMEFDNPELVAIHNALWSVLDEETDRVERASEDRALYVEDPDFFAVMAHDFESVAKRLRSGDFDPNEKIEFLLKWFVEALKEIKSFAAKLKGTTPRATGQRK